MMAVQYDLPTWHSYLRFGLEQDNERSSMEALRAIGRIRSRKSIPLLRRALESDDPRVQHAAVKAASAYKADPATVALLEQALPAATGQAVFDAIVSALQAVRSHNLPVLLRHIIAGESAYAASLAAPHVQLADPSLVVSDLLPLLAAPDLPRDDPAAYTIARLGQHAIPPLLSALMCQDRRTQLAAVRGLFVLGDASVAVRVSALAAADDFVHSALLASLLKEDGPAACCALMQSSDPRARAAALKHLSRIGQDALPVLLALIQADDTSVADEALCLLVSIGRSGLRAAVPFLPQVNPSIRPRLSERLTKEFPPSADLTVAWQTEADALD